MPIVTIPTPDGPITAHILCRKRGRKLCEFCRNLYVEKLCDFSTGRGKTCDAGMCAKCASSVGPDQDYCPRHKHEARPPQQQLFPEETI